MQTPSSPEPAEVLFIDQAVDVRPPSIVTCWRCGKPTNGDSAACLFCNASIGTESVALVRPKRAIRTDRAIIGLIWLYTAFLTSSIAVRVYEGPTPHVERELDEDKLKGALNLMLVIGAIDAALVLGTIAWVRRPPPLGPPRPVLRNLTWACTLPFLAGLLLMNFAYGRMLKNTLGLPDGQLEILQSKDLFYWVLLTVCVQPAIVEELFFRYLLLGHLRPVVGTHGAVIISGLMFGLCHIGNPLAIPLLILLGIGLGYARVGGRSMLIPMFLHFCHNAAVLWWEPWI